MSDIEKRAEIALCPFCGDWGAEVAESAVPSIHGGQKQAVYCNTCFCEGPTSETEKGAVEAWNRRAALISPEGFMLVPAEPTGKTVAVRVAAGDLSRYLVGGAVHTLGSISRLDQGPVRRKLIATLTRQVRSLKRNEDRIRAAKRAEVSGG